MDQVRLQHLLCRESLGVAVLEGDLVLDFSLLVQLSPQQEAQNAGVSYDYDLCPSVLSLRCLRCVDIFGYNRS